MKHSHPKRRHWKIALFALVMVSNAVGLPWVLNIGDTNVEFQNAGVVAATRNSYTIAAPIYLHQATGTSVSAGRLGLITAPGRMISGRQASSTINNGSAALLLENVNFTIDGNTAHGAALKSPSPPLVDALRQGRFAALRIANSTLAITLPNGRRERFSKLHTKFERFGRYGIRGTGTAFWRGQNINFTLSTAGAAKSRSSAIPIELKISGALFSVSLKGRLGTGHGLQLDGLSVLKTPDLPRLIGALGATWPIAFGVRKLSISGPFNWAGTVLAFAKASVQLDNNQASGALSMNTAGDKPVITGTLAFNELDLTSYVLAKSKIRTQKPEESSKTPAARSKPVKLPAAAASHPPSPLVPSLASPLASPLAPSPGWLQQLTNIWSRPMAYQFDADVRVSTEHVRLGKTLLGRAATTLTLRSGKASAHLANLSFDGGSGSGQLTMDFNSLVPSLALRGKLINAPVGQLIWALLGARHLDGMGTITTDLAAQGTTLHQLLSNLSGTFSADMPKGARLAFDLRTLDTERLLNLTNIVPQKLFEHARNGTTRLNSLKAHFSISGGQISKSDVRAEYADRLARLSGRTDLATRYIDLRLLIAPQIPSRNKLPKPPTQKVIQGSLLTAKGNWYAPKIKFSGHRGLRQELDSLLLFSRK